MRNMCIPKYNLIFLFCDIDTCVEQKCNQRIHTYKGAIGSLNSSDNSQNGGLATNQYLKILDPSLGVDLHKTWYGFY